MGRWGVESFSWLHVKIWVPLLGWILLLVDCFNIKLNSLDVRKITNLATLLLYDDNFLSSLILVDLIHELSNLRVCIEEMNVVILHHFFDGLF